MKPVRALIVDDEPIAREYLRSMLQHEPDLEIVGECRNGHEALTVLERGGVDLVFLDVQMPDLNGFDVLERLDRSRMPRVVFVTAYDEFAVRAFEVHALDYLLKPFDDQRLRETLSRVRSHFSQEDRHEITNRFDQFLKQLATARRPLDRIAIKDGDATTVLRVGEVDWIESESNYVRLHVGDRSYLSRTTLSGLEEKLDPFRFIRIHRTAIVNVDRIRKLTPRGRGDLRITLTDGTQLSLSRRYRDRLERVLEHLG
jgi:two-component system LytT family response regulator